MNFIRPAVSEDLGRIAEIEIFCYRMNFYPIFRNNEFYFGELQVMSLAEKYRTSIGRISVYDDGVVKGFVMTDGRKISKLFVEPVLQGNSIGSELLEHAVKSGADRLWALEKNTRAIGFYTRHGFRLTDERIKEDGTDEFLVRMERDRT